MDQPETTNLLERNGADADRAPTPSSPATDQEEHKKPARDAAEQPKHAGPEEKSENEGTSVDGAPLACPRGHGNPGGRGRFCTTCGERLVALHGAEAPQAAAPSPAAPGLAATPAPAPRPATLPTVPQICPSCGNGTKLRDGAVICGDCRSLRPLDTGYRVDPATFQWAQDGQAMARLRSMHTLHSMARRVSDSAGRKWIESRLNGVRLSERQMPKVYRQAVYAARVLGLDRMPDVYVSGEQPWDAMTFGSDNNAFVVMGSALVASFRGDDLSFLFAREMGHVLAGHALWKTVLRFLVGEHNPRTGIMKNGVVGLLDPGKWVEGAIEVPLLNWARQAEITADRAGLLVVGDGEIARRVLLGWSLKSPHLYRSINLEAWLKQQEEDAADEGIRMSEMVSSSTPYVTRRLKLLADYQQDPVVDAFHQRLQSLPEYRRSRPRPKSEHVLRIACPKCREPIAIPQQVLAGKDRLPVRCPRSSCRHVHVLQRKASRSKPTKKEQALLQAAD